MKSYYSRGESGGEVFNIPYVLWAAKNNSSFSVYYSPNKLSQIVLDMRTNAFLYSESIQRNEVKTVKVPNELVKQFNDSCLQDNNSPNISVLFEIFEFVRENVDYFSNLRRENGY